MGGDKDLIIHQEYSGGRNLSPLSTRFELLMYDEMKKQTKIMKAINKILEVSNEK